MCKQCFAAVVGWELQLIIIFSFGYMDLYDYFLN